MVIEKLERLQREKEKKEVQKISRCGDCVWRSAISECQGKVLIRALVNSRAVFSLLQWFPGQETVEEPCPLGNIVLHTSDIKGIVVEPT